MMILIRIDLNSVSRNLNAGATSTLFYGPAEKTVEVDGTVTIHHDIQTATHLPIPEFSYQFLLTIVKCDRCGAQFPWQKFQSDSHGDGHYSDEVCPFCNAWDCCDVKYEKPDYDIFRMILEMKK